MLGGALLLVAVLAGLLGYGRWRALKLAREWEKRAGVTITHETNGFTYSQAIKGKTVFTLHAAKALQHSDGLWTLKDAELTLYSRTSPRVDQIYGSEFEYDSKQGVARAVGEVHMDLQAPESLAQARTPQSIRGREGHSPNAQRDPGENLQTIHVRTSGLVYMRSLGVAATPEDVEFRYGGMEAHARGAEFDEGESVVHLLADVRISGEKNGQQVELRAAKADLDRPNNVATLASPVLRSQERTLSAASGVLHLRPDGSPESVDETGGVVLVAGTQQLHGGQLHVSLNSRMLPTAATLAGGVTLEDTAATRPVHGGAQRMEASFDAEGQPQVVTAIGGATLASTAWGAGHVPLERTASGDRIMLTLVGAASDSSRRELSEVHAVGHAQARAESMAAGVGKKSAAGVRRTTTLAGDELRAVFSPGDVQQEAALQHVLVNGHARMEQAVSTGERQTSSADALEIVFAPSSPTGAPGQLQIASATETGHVSIRNEAPAKSGPPTVSTAAADHAALDGFAQRLTLTGGAQFRQNGMAVMANSIAADQRSGDAVADGAVSATLLPAAGQGDASHVMGEHAIFSHGAQVAQFFGAEGRPARLWHGGSQVQAADLRMDGVNRTLSARPAAGGLVTAVFVGSGTPGVKARPDAAGSDRVVRVSSPKLDFSDRTREAVFSGGVTMRAATGDVRSQRAVVFLTAKQQGGGGSALTAADPAASSIERVVASGDVRFAEPGRSGSGDQLLYTASTNEFVLTGGPGHQPKVLDAQQGSVSGSTLVFGASDSTIVVSGDQGQGKRGRVRTETTLE